MTIQQGYGLVNRALSALEKDTAGADAVAVPAFISAMAGGFGSGLRMSDYEIRQVVDKAQTLWNKAASEMSRLGILPGQDQFIIGPTLRAQMKQLIADAKKRAENRLGSITDTSRKLKEAKTSDDVYGLRTDYWETTSGTDEARPLLEPMRPTSSRGTAPAAPSVAPAVNPRIPEGLR